MAVIWIAKFKIDLFRQNHTHKVLSLYFLFLQKERSRLSEFSDEANQLNTRIMQIKKILVKL